MSGFDPELWRCLTNNSTFSIIIVMTSEKKDELDRVCLIEEKLRDLYD